MHKSVGVVAALVVAVATGGCGEAERPQPPRAHSPKVALTLTWPGVAPWALITYQREDGRSCSALGTLTEAGPRIIGDLKSPVDQALNRRSGQCLDDRPVAIDVSTTAAGQLIGGLARRGVRRVIVGNQRIRPRRDGAFLVVNSQGPVGGSVGVVMTSGRRMSVPLPSATY